MGKGIRPVSIAGIEFDALINSNESYEANVPEYTTETGFPVSDTIILGAETLDMTLFVSNMPVTWRRRFGSSGDRVDRVVKKLKSLYMSKSLVTVKTSSGTYSSMAIISLTISRSNTLGYAREIPIKLKKVRTTSSKTTVIPDSYGKSGATGASAGTVNTSSGTGGSSDSNAKESGGNTGSVAYNLANNAGLWG